MHSTRTRRASVAALALAAFAGATIVTAATAQSQASPATPSDAVVFSGRSGLGGGFLTQGSTVVSPDGVRQGTGWSMTDVWEASDPRLSGDVRFVRSYAEFPGPDGVAVEAGSRRLVNDGGSWSAVIPSVAAAGLPTIDVFTFTGEGGYEGLSAYVVLEYEAGTFQGAIFPGTYPEAPTDA